MFRGFVALAVLAGLAGCAAPEAEGVQAAEAALASHRASLQALGAPPRRSPASIPTNALANGLGRLTPEAGGYRQASQFLGATPDTLLAALGEPLLRRDEAGAAVWLYAAGGCQLDIVFYQARVAHVQARAGGLAQRTEAACVRDLTAQRAQTPAGRGPAPELGA